MVMLKLLIATTMVAAAQAVYTGSYASAGSSGRGSQPFAYGGFWPGFNGFPFNNFAAPALHLPSVDEIANAQPGPNQNYNGIAVKSVSSSTRDKDGNIVRTGGSTVLTNDNGVTNEYTVGDNPPNLQEPLVNPTVRRR